MFEHAKLFTILHETITCAHLARAADVSMETVKGWTQVEIEARRIALIERIEARLSLEGIWPHVAVAVSGLSIDPEELRDMLDRGTAPPEVTTEWEAFMCEPEARLIHDLCADIVAHSPRRVVRYLLG